MSSSCGPGKSCSLSPQPQPHLSSRLLPHITQHTVTTHGIPSLPEQHSAGSHTSPAQPCVVPRRAALVAAVVAPCLLADPWHLSWPLLPGMAVAASQEDNGMVLYVAPPTAAGNPAPTPSPGPAYPTISSALAAVEQLRRGGGASGPVTVEVAAGQYRERILLPAGLDDVTIRAAPQGAAVDVVWQTSEPYQSTVFCAAAGTKLVGLTIRHASKSVANNYGVYIVEGSDLVLDKCDISSTTGSGVGVEGAQPTLIECRVHGCTRHGVAVFGPLDPLSSPPGGGTLQGCDVSENAGEGVLVRDGAAPNVTNCNIHDNKGWGVSLQFSGGSYRGNSVRGNARGALQVRAAVDLDVDTLTRDNTLMGAVELQ